MSVPETILDDPQNAGTDDAVTATDDVLVLPWWQHPLNILTMLLATALIAGMVGWLVHEAVAGDDGGDVDVGFLQDMRFHHEQAVTMGFLYLDDPGTDTGLRTVARSIVMGQSIEIGRMIQLLRDFDAPEARDVDEPTMRWMGHEGSPDTMPGMATEAQLDELTAADGRQADELFVELMTAHHRGGIEMAEYAAEHAESGEVREAAASMATGQQEEIGEMERLLQG